MKSALKRKVPSEVEALLSGGSSTSKPINVDALNAILERFLVKCELQVCNFKMATRKQLLFFQYVKQEIILSNLEEKVRDLPQGRAKPP